MGLTLLDDVFRLCSFVSSARRLNVSPRAGSNSSLLRLLGEEAHLARRRIDEHWKKVREKQQLCQQLKRQLELLNDQLRTLERQETRASNGFAAVLQPLQRHRDYCQQVYNASVARNSHRNEWLYNPEVTAARSASTEAETKYSAMNAEQNCGATGASSQPGKFLQNARCAVTEKHSSIASVEGQLENAMKPPAPVIQPLPDPRESECNTLAVLFFVRSDVTGSMPLLQQLCCVAQLALCPWPVDDEPLCDAFSSPDLSYSTWNEYFSERTASCSYLSQPARAATAAAVTTSSAVHFFASFKVPESKEVCMCSIMS